jgi:hypothetical protein
LAFLKSLSELAAYCRLGGLCFACLLTGCAFFESQLPGAEQAASVESTAQEPAVPFVLSVAKEENDGQTLRVVADVIPQVAWPSDNAMVRLATYRNGALLQERYFPIAAALAPSQEEFKSQEKVSLAMQVPSVGMTDYQLELLWGEEALRISEQLQSEARPLLRISELEIERKREECNGFPCDIVFVLRGVVENTGQEVLGDIVLAVGFIRVDGDVKRPENEEKVPLSGLELAAGDKRPLRLVIDRRIPETEAGKYKPVLRIAAFKSRSQAALPANGTMELLSKDD